MIDEIVENFSLIEDWEDRYRYVIELGGMLASYPDGLRDEAHKVRGCTSQVWLNVVFGDADNEATGEKFLYFIADSDAHIVRGLLYIVLALYNGKKSTEILALDADAFLARLGLDEHLTPQRANGVRAVIDRIRTTAREFLKKNS